WTGQKNQLTEEIVPGPNKGEDRGCGQSGHRQRKDDTAKDAYVPATVDAGSFVQVLGQPTDELNHQEDEEPIGGQELGHDERPERVDPAELGEQYVLRNDHDVDGKHDRASMIAKKSFLPRNSSRAKA